MIRKVKELDEEGLMKNLEKAQLFSANKSLFVLEKCTCAYRIKDY